ncbi:MAG: DUF6691 family protein [Nocardioidaceae bacterium]
MATVVHRRPLRRCRAPRCSGPDAWSRRGTTYSALGVGVAFGFFMTGSGLGDYRTIHEGLLLRDPYIYLMMASTEATAAVGFALLRRRGRTRFGGPLHIPRRPVRRPAVYGGAVFGVGFGVGATCPGITVSAIATGSWCGAVVLLGISAGCGSGDGSSDDLRVGPRTDRRRTTPAR